MLFDFAEVDNYDINFFDDLRMNISKFITLIFSRLPL